MEFIVSKPTIRRLWLIVLLALCLAGMTFVLDVAAQANEGPRLSIIVEALNVRDGPGVAYPAIAYLVQGDEVAVIGRHSPSDWWQVQLEDGSTGWVSGGPAYVQVSGDIDGVPEVSAPATSVTTPAAAGQGGTAPSTAFGTSTIVFQTASGGPIYAINPDGSNLRLLTTGIDPALSPDGQQVAFTRWDNPQNGAFGNLWVINVDGTGERPILGDVRQPKSPVWSPDGTQIAISMQEGGRLEPEYRCSRGFPSGPIEDLEDIEVKVDVGDDGDVEVKLCYTLLSHPFWGLRLVDVASGEFEDLPRDIFSYTPAWDPVNDWHLVYDGEGGLVNLDINQGNTWALTEDPGDHMPVFSPDGSRLAVAYKQHDHWDIHVMNADGSGRARLTETPLRVVVEQRVNGQEPRSWNNVAPVWSPDGSQIAFLTDRNGSWEIWIMNADGRNQRPLFPAGTLGDVELQYFNVGERALSWQ